MQWKGRRQSENVEDRRGQRPGKGMIAGGGVGTIVLALVILFLGGDPSQLLQGATPGGAGGGTTEPAPTNPVQDELAAFTAVVLADTEDVWNRLLDGTQYPYREPKLVIFTGKVQSACGFASSATGPFYCPGDEQIYIDLGFYEDLQKRFGAPGDFAQAYVIAHEVGHHIQKILGISDMMHRQRQRLSKTEYNKLSVRLELQADFFAGVWAHHAQKAKKILDEGDLQEALRCAQSIGDDRLQMQAQGYVVPESFNHGTSAQREAWFRHGWTTGDLSKGDTFDDDVFYSVTPR